MELEPIDSDSECVFSNSFFDDESDDPNDVANQVLPPSPKRSRVDDLNSVLETEANVVDDDNVLHVLKSRDEMRTEKDVKAMEKSVTHVLSLNTELQLNANKIYYAKKSVPPFEEPVQQISNKGDEKTDKDDESKGVKKNTQRKKTIANKKENKEPQEKMKLSIKKTPKSADENAKKAGKGANKKKSTTKTTQNGNMANKTAKEVDSNKDKKNVVTAKSKSNKDKNVITAKSKTNKTKQTRNKTKKTEANASTTAQPKTSKSKATKKTSTKRPSFPKSQKMMKGEQGVLHSTRIATLSRASSTSSLDEEPMMIDPEAPNKKGEKTGVALQRRLHNETMVHNEIYVECCIKSCAKWRFLANVHDAREVPEFWTCSMNPDPMFNSCDKPESTNMASSSQCIECI